MSFTASCVKGFPFLVVYPSSLSLVAVRLTLLVCKSVLYSFFTSSRSSGIGTRKVIALFLSPDPTDVFSVVKPVGVIPPRKRPSCANPIRLSLIRSVRISRSYSAIMARKCSSIFEVLDWVLILFEQTRRTTLYFSKKFNMFSKSDVLLPILSSL